MTYAQSSQTVTCKPGYERFQTFLEKFSEDVEFQLQSIKYPLRKYYIDNAGPPTGPTTKVAVFNSAAALKGRPVFSARAVRTKRLLELRIREISDLEMEVVLEKPSTDYKLEFRFRKIGGCWLLTEFSDLSF